MKSIKKEVFFWLVILTPYLCLIPAYLWYAKTLKNVRNSSFIVINKGDYSLSHYNYKGELLQKSKVALGVNPGNKQEVGDLKTPEGIFRIISVEDASGWTHDFEGDSLGKIEYAYGPNFIRLEVPNQKGIGIHGTHDDLSIGTRASEGCIRMHNEDLKKLVKGMESASIVVIVPGVEDQEVNYYMLDSTFLKIVVK